MIGLRTKASSPDKKQAGGGDMKLPKFGERLSQTEKKVTVFNGMAVAKIND